ncbi:hypothetical protein DTO013E5_9724 [Penicillium roqueforti]|uniref:Putative gamma-glutamylcyclotransferase n=1 Tax=Penicillium roqueforti (strain FM164) TaxID=1365484 RepID=W6QW75_PENRF|nr:hypothetical protein DTO012A1_9787 [Penicillium roqueforti]CDM38409.1 AIG2-like [Penicillium roqueforti FM164]KAI2737424.1 hypothetical protein DTO013F2_9798 [Penicillium roqueforti]KAI2767786.1 hypothetical protein DTO012A8_7001 [Penicillium roqueforti]KAI3063081.1 hypothetical protein CBS147339_9751 [Penicillium roqueforti]
MSNTAREEMNLTSPPPPPPPPPEIPGSKISSYVLKLRTAPSDYFFQAPNPPQYVDLFDAPTGPYFFYGTLTDPSMVREILELETEPELRPARLSGYECKLWGQYPALLDAPDSVIEGAVYHVKTVEHGERLAAYETQNYQASPCRIRYTDGKEPADDVGYTFKFKGNRKDLSEGIFDLRVWLERMGRLAAVEKLDAKKRNI